MVPLFSKEDKKQGYFFDCFLNLKKEKEELIQHLNYLLSFSMDIHQFNHFLKFEIFENFATKFFYEIKIKFKNIEDEWESITKN